LTKNKVYVPPLNYGFEFSIEQKKVIINNALKLWDNSLVTDYGLVMLEKEGYDYIFVGQKQGIVNSPQTYRLNEKDILKNGNSNLLFGEDYIYLLEISNIE